MKTFEDTKKVRKNAASKGGKVDGKAGYPEGFSWGFCAVVCSTLGLAAFLMFSAWGRFSGVAWGSLKDERDAGAEGGQGFIAVDMSDTYEGRDAIFPSS